jgi:hypothetical protein
MSADESHEKVFIIPTRLKSKIGSYLSWPTGALELTKALSKVPQIKSLQLEFCESSQNQRKGKWPVSCRVIEVRYAYHRTKYAPIAGWNDGSWNLMILAVPREIRSKIREALKAQGFGLIEDWLKCHAHFSGREGNLNFVGNWNSELDELDFEQRETVLPEVSGNKHIKIQ